MDCAGCGRCCDPVWLPLTALELTQLLSRISAGARVSSPDGEENLRFIGEHMVPVVPQPDTYLDGGPAETSGHTAWRCDRYDPVARLCTSHDDRPPICRGWPWYGEEPYVMTSMPDECSHQWDVAGTPAPVERRLLPLWPV